MKLTYFGHSAFQIETEGTTLLFDPFITGNKHTKGVVTADDLEPDVILLTHAHGDHWGDTPSIAARTGATVVGTHEIVEYIGRQHDYENVQPMNTGGSWTFDWGRIKFTYARHSSSFPDGTYGGTANGILLYLEDKVIYAAGDTCPFSEMEWIGEENLDLALLPIGDCYTMGPDDALKAIGMLRPKRVIPVHYNTFPLVELDAETLKVWPGRVAGLDASPHMLGPGATLEL